MGQARLARLIPPRPQIDAEACLLLVNRAYCLLRLSGVSAKETWDLVRKHLVDADADADGGCGEEVWQRFLDSLKDSAAWKGRPQPHPQLTPPLHRSSIGYPEAGREVVKCEDSFSRPEAKRSGTGDPVPWRATAFLRRLLFALLVPLHTLLATYVMVAVLPYHGSTLLEASIVGVFALLFAWIAAGFWMSLFGFVVRRMGDSLSLRTRFPRGSLADVQPAPTAVVMPIYHEDIERSLAGLRAVYRDLQRAGALDAFEFFVLSDSRDPHVWLAEQEGWYRLCEDLGSHGKIHYRRRRLSLNRKVGNVGDFLRRWGRRFRYLVVLDADSVISGETLLHMVRVMERSPQIGILQSAPRLVNASSAFARLQQFASHAYGPLFNAGLSSIQLGDAMYWGHNAVLRVEPFMRHCGLRRLRGPAFLRGAVLSHDFVEAALMRRAGYEVWLDPEVGDSYEESPPTLPDELARDRRWAKGSLQHLWFLFAPGIRLAHRWAFLNGIMSYVSSALWLLFLALITIETARLVLLPIDYFPEPHALRPLWPEWRPDWALGLALGTAAVLLAPKLLGLIDVLLDSRRRRRMGGSLRITSGVLTETLFSFLLAPIRMLAHARFVLESLLDLRVRWEGQNRTREIGWHDAVRRHAAGSLLALAWALFALWLNPLFLFWSLPVALPLILAAPLSVMLSRFDLGNRWRERGLLQIPEEADRPAVLQDLADQSLLRQGALSGFEAAVVDPWRNALQWHLARRRRDGDWRHNQRRHLIERCLSQGPEGLDQSEIDWLAGDAQALEELHQGAWKAAPRSAWARRVERLCNGSSQLPQLNL
jgi:membrane glycosyltransferase